MWMYGPAAKPGCCTPRKAAVAAVRCLTVEANTLDVVVKLQDGREQWLRLTPEEATALQASLAEVVCARLDDRAIGRVPEEMGIDYLYCRRARLPSATDAKQMPGVRIGRLIVRYRPDLTPARPWVVCETDPTILPASTEFAAYDDALDAAFRRERSIPPSRRRARKP